MGPSVSMAPPTFPCCGMGSQAIEVGRGEGAGSSKMVAKIGVEGRWRTEARVPRSCVRRYGRVGWLQP